MCVRLFVGTGASSGVASCNAGAVALVYTAFTWILTDNQLRSGIGCACPDGLALDDSCESNVTPELALVLLGVAWASAFFNYSYTTVFARATFHRNWRYFGPVLFSPPADYRAWHQLARAEACLERAVADRTVELNRLLM